MSEGRHQQSGLSLTEAADTLGCSVELLQTLWQALGFTKESSHTATWTADEIAATALFLAARDTLDQDALIAAARVMGQSMARLAEWEAEQVLAMRNELQIDIPAGDIVAAIGRLQTMVWERHLRDALARDLTDTADPEVESVVGFADLVGYTALSRRLTLPQLAELLDVFEDRAYLTVTEHGGRVIKTLGDAIMFTTGDPVAAALIAVGLSDAAGDDTEPAMPPLRIGLARGTVLSRAGDVYGEPVNIAARLAGIAQPGTILVDSNLFATLETDPRFRLRRIPPHPVRGYRRLAAYALSSDRHWQHPTDEDEIGDDPAIG